MSLTPVNGALVHQANQQNQRGVVSYTPLPVIFEQAAELFQANFGGLAQNELCEKVFDIDAKITLITSSSDWPRLSKGNLTFPSLKLLTIKMGEVFVSFAISRYSAGEQISATGCWKQAEKYLLRFANESSLDPVINYRHCFELSTLYLYRLQQHERSIEVLKDEDRLDLIEKGLKWTDSALQIFEEPEALLRKYMFLRLKEKIEGKAAVAFASTPWLKKYLGREKEDSEDYLLYSHVYGGELAAQGRMAEAKVWFENLVESKNDPVTHLSLGKLANSMGENQEALRAFKKAHALSPDNLEITLWLVSQKTKNNLRELESFKEHPSQGKVEELVEGAKEFFKVCVEARDLDQETSNFIPISQVADHFFTTMVPDIALRLGQLGRFEYSLTLYKTFLDAFDRLAKAGTIAEKERVKLHIVIGMLHTNLNQFKQAEEHLLIALKIDNARLIAYDILLKIYSEKKDKNKIAALWDRFKPLSNNSTGQLEEAEISNTLFNFGNAYGSFGADYLTEGRVFYERSLELDEQNNLSKVSLARIHAFKGEFAKAKQLLMPYLESSTSYRSPFNEAPLIEYQVYFTISGIMTILGDFDLAKRAYLKAAKTGYSKEIQLLWGYIETLKDPVHKERLPNEIMVSLLQFEFRFRVGRLISDKAITFTKGQFVGYHGTTSPEEDFQNGIQPKKAVTSQHGESGFYISDTIEMARYFAMKRAKEEGKGIPRVLKIVANKELTGQEIESRAIKSRAKTQFDFFRSKIDGWEFFNQYFFPEQCANPDYLTIAEVENVGWTDQEYQQFLGSWERKYN